MTDGGVLIACFCPGPVAEHFTCIGSFALYSNSVTLGHCPPLYKGRSEPKVMLKLAVPGLGWGPLTWFQGSHSLTCEEPGTHTGLCGGLSCPVSLLSFHPRPVPSQRLTASPLGGRSLALPCAQSRMSRLGHCRLPACLAACTAAGRAPRPTLWARTVLVSNFEHRS